MRGTARDEPSDASLGGLVHDLDTAAPYELVGVCSRWLRDVVGTQACSLLLVDHGQTSLEPVPGPAGTPETRHDVASGPAGDAYRDQRLVEQRDDDSFVIYLPVTIRAERLGVLSVALPRPPSAEDAKVLTDVARILAYVLTGAQRFTDRFEVLRRRRDLGLAAEIQWELLPVLAYDMPAFSIAGALEPAYDIGGDTFDYAVSATRLTVSVTDAVGHGLRAALLGSLAVAAMRNARRCGHRVLRQAQAADGNLAAQFPGSSFVTGLVLEIAVPDGSGVVVNAGHPPPLLLREGTVRVVPFAPDLPLGLLGDTTYRLQQVDLRPRDRLLLITDGISEAHATGGPQFGTERVAALLEEHAHRSPGEFVRHLTQAVLTFRSGQLTDDITAVCLDWHGAS